ncbi:MAG: response regulator [Polyangiaceae bacterium]|nr:response regulator [Polyangiaceae bacterium]
MTEAATRILVVDDEPGARLTLAANLELEGYDVVTAEDASQALDALLSGDFALVITDFQMPGMDGLDMLRAIRRAKPEQMVVMATGFANESRVESAIGEGAFAIVSKPFPMEQLLGVVEHACRGPVVVVVDDPAEAAVLAGDLKQHFVAAVACSNVACALELRDADVFVTATTLVNRAFLDELNRRSANGEKVTLVFITDEGHQRVPKAAIPGFIIRRPPKVPWLLKTIADSRGIN